MSFAIARELRDSSGYLTDQSWHSTASLMELAADEIERLSRENIKLKASRSLLAAQMCAVLASEARGAIPWPFSHWFVQQCRRPLPRRRLTILLSILSAGLFVASVDVSSALDFPSSPIHWVVGFPPGGGTDTVARVVGQSLSERLGQPLVIENRPGSGTNIATQAVANSPPDGYTLLFCGVANAIGASVYAKLPYDFIRDIAPVAGIARVTNVMVVNPSVPANGVAEFIAYAKAHPGQINMASSGNGTSVHLSGELFKMMTGTNMIHVPYRGGALAHVDLISGRVQVMFDNLPSVIEHIRAGKLRALAVTGRIRSAALPDVPTIAETVPGYETSAWYGMCAPKATPAGIVQMLNGAVQDALADPKVRARFDDLGVQPMINSIAEFGQLIADETEKWTKVVKAAGIRIE
jgi:tripartite-type tricarboxylate transporter receptor subunit TctC